MSVRKAFSNGYIHFYVVLGFNWMYSSYVRSSNSARFQHRSGGIEWIGKYSESRKSTENKAEYVCRYD